MFCEHVVNWLLDYNMNIFYLDRDEQKAAQYHCDKHVVKMILESAQLLSTAHRVLDGIVVEGKTGDRGSAHPRRPAIAAAAIAASTAVYVLCVGCGTGADCNFSSLSIDFWAFSVACCSSCLYRASVCFHYCCMLPTSACKLSIRC